MKPYPAYKDSGIEWIGEIPEHWEISKAKYRSKIVLGKMLTPNDKGNYQLKSYLKAKNILWEKVNVSEVEEMWFSEYEMNQYRLQLNDLVVSEGGEVGRTAIWMNELEECYIQNSVHKVTVNIPHNPKYFLFQFIVYGKRGYFDSIVSRVSIAHLTREKLKEVTLIVPSPEEQQSITNFLEYKTSQIDALIDKKQKQIELLKEERTAIINQAVTKGLNPDVPMKDSGIEWLREVPKHWEVKPLKHLLLDGKDGIKIGPFGSSLKSNILTEDGFKVYGQENIINNDFSIGHRFIDDATFEELNVYEIFEGDILITMMGTTGKSKVAPSNIQKGIMDSHLIRIRTRASVNSHLISLLINDSHYIFSQIKQNSKGSIMEGLNSSIIKSLLVLCPPKFEQDAILSFIGRSMKEIVNELNVTEKQINLLQEYRTALISNAVTGKIDVRDTPKVILE